MASQGERGRSLYAEHHDAVTLCYWPKARNLPDTPASGVLGAIGSGMSPVIEGIYFGLSVLVA